ncbi:DNA repair protein RadA [Iamia majanohamensis]|uniref:DNA repair protein RadA n=1 Tax=Iamia majanohamensis TaxID=467976 RepID=A0AAE9YB51_9ACTN|nr:DNA repair protein RadA [Iamia majanohamensis]WCO67769.1 DNA repair protein RadA [Iamia majanohamensis]
MARARTVHRCSDCGATTPQWVGRCPGCGAWSTLEEEVAAAPVAAPAWAGWGTEGGAEPARPSTDGGLVAVVPRPTGVEELDRVLSGGLVPGSVTLLGGAPGTGKSTLVLQASAGLARAGATVLYACAEESPAQVRDRARRLDALHDRLWLVGESLVPRVLAAVDEVRPDVLVVDSAQSVADPEVSSTPGSATQVREVAQRLVREAKARDLAVVLIGHVTKEGALAGPRVLEHVVDTVLELDGDRHHALRLLRAVKHRFGSTSELGLFELGERGLEGVPDPSGLFLADRLPGVAGSTVVPTIEGHRPLLVEVQALVASSSLSEPRRSSTGLDRGRVSLLLAVLAKRVGLAVAGQDVYALAAGGVRVTEPGADLALALAVTSATTSVPVPPDVVACGEVGLAGEVRTVASVERRLSEAARLGFTRAVVPASSPAPPPGIDVVRVRSLKEAIAALRLVPDP